MDIIGQILWVLMFITPLLTVPLTLKYGKQRIVWKIIVGLAAACVLSLLLYSISLAIIFRNGMGN